MTKSENKQRILDFLKAAENGATYADMIGGLQLHRVTLRRWTLELEREGVIERAREQTPFGRAVFSVVDMIDVTPTM